MGLRWSLALLLTCPGVHSRSPALPFLPPLVFRWGINYYSQPCLSGFFVMGASDKNEPVFDNQFRLCPQVRGKVIGAYALRHGVYA